MSEEERSESATEPQDEASSPAEDAPPGGDGDGAGPSREAAGEEVSEHLSEEIREELEELDELRDRHLRLAAEFENYRKRTRREMGEARERGRADLAGRLLDALDDLDRLVASLEEEGASDETLGEGLEMVRRKLWKELSDAGLERIEADGEPFDPEVHDGLLTSPTDDPEEDQQVSRVLIQGYRFGDRVLRPARVEVKKYGGGDADDGGHVPDDGGGEA